MLGAWEGIQSDIPEVGGVMISIKLYEQYEHYDRIVWVRSDLKGKHREHCLCWNCKHFAWSNLRTPSSREENCKIANVVYSLCVRENLVLPVWECPDFEMEGWVEQK